MPATVPWIIPPEIKTLTETEKSTEHYKMATRIEAGIFAKAYRIENRDTLEIVDFNYQTKWSDKKFHGVTVIYGTEHSKANHYFTHYQDDTLSWIDFYMPSLKKWCMREYDSKRNVRDEKFYYWKNIGNGNYTETFDSAYVHYRYPGYSKNGLKTDTCSVIIEGFYQRGVKNGEWKELFQCLDHWYVQEIIVYDFGKIKSRKGFSPKTKEPLYEINYDYETNIVNAKYFERASSSSASFKIVNDHFEQIVPANGPVVIIDQNLVDSIAGGQMKNGKKEGPWMFYHVSSLENSELSNYPELNDLRFLDSLKKLFRYNIPDPDEFTGLLDFYALKGDFKDGKKEGAWSAFDYLDPPGLKFGMNFKNDLAEGIFYELRTHYGNGPVDTALSWNFARGRLNGRYMESRPDYMEVYEVGQYSNGVKTGEAKQWWLKQKTIPKKKRGKLYASGKYEFVNYIKCCDSELIIGNVKQGTWKYFDEKGNVTEQRKYDKGELTE